MQVVIGTAGHIDHGKTSIVKALTGKNTDNLIEEKNTSVHVQISIHCAFASTSWTSLNRTEPD